MGIYIADDARYSSMQYCRCGNSGLQLPRFSLGLWHNFGKYGDFSNMTELCRTAFDSGITHFDLANNYGPDPGFAEENFGRILNSDLKPYRDELIITTKAGYDMWPGPYGSWGSRKHLIASVEQSLLRMRCEYVDIVYHHRMDKNTPLEESMGALADLVRAGKALYVGISNYDQPAMERAVQILRELRCPCIVNQRRYSLFDRTIEQDGVKASAQANEVGIVAFSPLAQGLLSDKYLHGIPSRSRIATDSRFLQASSLTEQRLAQIAALNELAFARGQTLPQMALAWVLKDSVCSALIGASALRQILEDIHSLDHPEFSSEELEKIDAICRSNTEPIKREVRHA